MAKKKQDYNLRYMNLAILSFVLAAGLELLNGQVWFLTLPDYIMNFAIASIYIIFASFATAFVWHTTVTKEQKYIFYLVIMALTFFRVMTLLKEYI